MKWGYPGYLKGTVCLKQTVQYRIPLFDPIRRCSIKFYPVKMMTFLYQRLRTGTSKKQETALKLSRRSKAIERHHATPWKLSKANLRSYIPVLSNLPGNEQCTIKLSTIYIWFHLISRWFSHQKMWFPIAISCLMPLPDTCRKGHNDTQGLPTRRRAAYCPPGKWGGWFSAYTLGLLVVAIHGYYYHAIPIFPKGTDIQRQCIYIIYIWFSTWLLYSMLVVSWWSKDIS